MLNDQILIYWSITCHLPAKYKPPYWTLRGLGQQSQFDRAQAQRHQQNTSILSGDLYSSSCRTDVWILHPRDHTWQQTFRFSSLPQSWALRDGRHGNSKPLGMWAGWLLLRVSEWVLTVACGNWTLNTVRVHWKQGYFTLDVILGESFIVVSLKLYVRENVQSGGHYQKPERVIRASHGAELFCSMFKWFILR